MPRPPDDLLVRHFRQLRSTRGTVLLGPEHFDEDAPDMDPSWFVDGCPLEPEAAVTAIAKRHGFRGPKAARTALRRALEELRERGDRDAVLLADLPED